MMPQSLRQISFQKNTHTAIALVATVSIVIWIIFNAFVDAYPPKSASFQAVPTPTTTVAQPLDYHYDNENF